MTSSRRPLAELGAFRREPDAGEREIDRHQDPKQRQRIGRERQFPLGRVLLIEVDDGIETVRRGLRGDGVRRKAQSGDKNKESDEAGLHQKRAPPPVWIAGVFMKVRQAACFEGVAIGAGLNGVRLQARVRQDELADLLELFDVQQADLRQRLQRLQIALDAACLRSKA